MNNAEQYINFIFSQIINSSHSIILQDRMRKKLSQYYNSKDLKKLLKTSKRSLHNINEAGRIECHYDSQNAQINIFVVSKDMRETLLGSIHCCELGAAWSLSTHLLACLAEYKLMCFINKLREAISYKYPKIKPLTYSPGPYKRWVLAEQSYLQSVEYPSNDIYALQQAIDDMKRIYTCSNS